MINMNKIEIGLLIAVIFIVCYIGGMLYYEMAYELEQHPEIKDIGGPPVPDLKIMTVTLVSAAIICGILLKLSPPAEKPDE